MTTGGSRSRYFGDSPYKVSKNKSGFIIIIDLRLRFSMIFYIPSLQVAHYLLIVLEANWYCNSLRFSVSSVRDRSCGADVPWWISRCGVRSEKESGKPTLCEPVVQFFTMSQTVPKWKKNETDVNRPVLYLSFSWF